MLALLIRILYLFMILLTPRVCRGADEARGLRVMSFNIRYDNPRDGENQWRFRKQLFNETVRAFGPDLLGTQEVVAGQLDDLREMFPEYTCVGVARDDGKRKGEWSAIFFRTERFEKVAAGDFWLSETPEEVGSKGWDADCVRICTWARLRDRVSGRTFLHANTHFDHLGKTARRESAALLRARLPLIAKDAPLVLTGDFNCSEDDAPYKILLGQHDDRLRLLDSHRARHPKRASDEGTFHGFNGTMTDARIDWILHTPHFRTLSAGIVRSVAPPFPSDHFPITAVLGFEK